jgi:pumilio homology domain family member 6
MPRATKSAGLNAKAKRKERREEKFNNKGGGGGEGGAATTGKTFEDEEGGNKQKKKHKGNQHEDKDNNKKSKNTSSSFKSSNASNGNGDKKAWKSGGIGGGSGGFKKTASSQQQQQQQTQSQKQKQGFAKPNFQLIEELVLIFEKLRQTKDSSKSKNGGGNRGKGKRAGDDDDDDDSDNDNNSRDAGKKKEYATLIYSKTKGKIPEIANNHKGSRIVQSLLKYGTEEQINSVFAECAPKLAILAKSLYGNFLIRKLIEKTKKEDYPQLLQNVKGQVTSLARHPVGSQILEHLYHSAKGEQRAQMQAEFYGGEFVHFSNASSMTKKDGKNANKEPPTLKDILLQKPAMQRQNTLKNISRSILPILEKGLVSPLIVHKVLKEYLLVGGASLRAEAANSIAAPAFLRLFHTREGATATNVMLSYAGAKQRKQVLKALKTQVWRVSQDECAHSTIMTLIDCVDDTNMLNKIILQELKSEDIAGIVCEHKFGKRVILHLLRPRLNKYSPPNLQMMMLSPEEIHQSVEAAKALVKTLQKQQKKINRHDNDGDDGEDEIEDDEILKDSSNKKSEGNKRKLSSDGGSDSEEDEEEAEGADVNFGVAKKSEQQRRLEVFKQYGFAEALVKSCQDNIDRMLRSKESGDVLYEVIIGGLDDVVHESCGEGKMNAFYERIAEVVTESVKSAKADAEDNLLENFFSTRLLRRAAQDCPRFAKVLFDSSICASSSLQKKWLSMPHAEKIIAGVLSCPDEKFVTEAKAKMGADADAILAKVIAKKEKHRDNAAKGKA